MNIQPIMPTNTDERGRIYLPKDVLEQFGEWYRIVEIPTHVELFLVADDPFAVIKGAVGNRLEGTPWTS